MFRLQMKYLIGIALLSNLFTFWLASFIGFKTALITPFVVSIVLLCLLTKQKANYIKVVCLALWCYLPLLLCYVVVSEHHLSLFIWPTLIHLGWFATLILLKKRIGKIISNSRQLILFTLAGVIPLTFVVVVQSSLGMYPGGSVTFLTADLKSQYVSYHYYLYDLLLKGFPWNYTFHGGMGLENLSFIGYYLLNPLSLLVVIVQKAHIVYYMQIVFWLKVFVGGITMAVYLSSHFKSLSYKILFFATSYALCGYMVVYQGNIMWLDSVIIFPLVLLGVDRLIAHGKFMLLIAALTFTFITNFYIGCMAAIGASIYWLIRYVETTTWQKGVVKNFFASIGKFIYSGIISALLAAPVIIPILFAIKAQPKIATHLNWFSFNLTDPMRSLAKLYSGVTYPMVTETNNAPNDYIGLLGLLCVLLFLFAKNIPLKSKMIWTLGCFFLVLATQSQVLYYLMHGLAMPNGWPYRFIFILSALLIVMAARIFMQLENVHKLAFYCAGFGLLFFVYILRLMEPDLISKQVMIVNGLLIVIFTFCLLMLNSRKNSLLIFMLLTLCFSAEMFYNLVHTNKAYKKVALTEKNFNQDDQQKSVLYRFYNRDKAPFNRIAQVNQGAYSNNDSFRYQFDGVTNYNSMSPKNVNRALLDLGLSSSSSGVWARYDGSTLITDALFGVGYNITKSFYHIQKYGYNSVTNVMPFELQKNKNVLPLGFMLNYDNEDLNKKLMSANQDYFNRQNRLFADKEKPESYFTQLAQKPATVSGGKAVLNKNGLTIKKDASATEAKVRFKLAIKGKQQLYLRNSYYPFTWHKKMQTGIWVNGKKIAVYQSPLDRNIANLGLYKDQNVNITFVVKKPKEQFNNFSIVGLDVNKFSKRITELKKNALSIQKEQANHIKGALQAERNGQLFLSIPYSKGWHAKVDGKYTELEPTLNNAFMQLPVKKGKQQIELVYQTPGLQLGVILLSLGIILIGGQTFLQSRRRKLRS